MGFWHFDTESLNKVITWGKYKNCTLEYVLEVDKDYIKWLTENKSVSFSPEVAHIIEQKGIVKKVKNVKLIVKKNENKQNVPKVENEISFVKAEQEAKKILLNVENENWTKILSKVHSFNMTEIYEINLEEGVLRLYAEVLKDKNTMQWKTPKFKAVIIIKTGGKNYEKQLKLDTKDNYVSLNKLQSVINKKTIDEKKKIKEKQVLRITCNLTFTDVIVLSNTMKCYKNHNVEDVVAVFNVVDKEGKYFQEKVATTYCKECDVFFVHKADFKLMKCNRILLHRIIEEHTFVKGRYLDKDFKYDLADESPLFICGYNVNSKKNLSVIQRRIILEYVIDSKILTRGHVLAYLDYFIFKGEKKPSMEKAVDKWKQDRAYIKEYKINSGKHIYVDKIITNEYTVKNDK